MHSYSTYLASMRRCMPFSTSVGTCCGCVRCSSRKNKMPTCLLSRLPTHKNALLNNWVKWTCTFLFWLTDMSLVLASLNNILFKFYNEAFQGCYILLIDNRYLFYWLLPLKSYQIIKFSVHSIGRFVSNWDSCWNFLELAELANSCLYIIIYRYMLCLSLV